MNRNLTCSVCKTATSKYTCPRCRVPYCSLNCYNQHSNNCTESFYKDHVQNELSLRSGGTSLTGPETVREKSKMLDILKRTANNEEFDERDLQLEMQQLEIIANKNEKDVTLEDLTPEQKRDFLRAVADGSIGREVLQVWQPWWIVCKDNHSHLYRPMVSETTKEKEQAKQKTNTTNESTATSVNVSNASPTIRFNLLNVLLSYVAVERLYNGAMTTTAAAAAAAANSATTSNTTKTTTTTTTPLPLPPSLDPSPIDIADTTSILLEYLNHATVLSEDARYENVAQVAMTFVERWCSRNGIDPLSSVEPLRDVMHLLKSKCCIIETLHIVRVLFKNVVKKDTIDRKLNKETKKSHGKEIKNVVQTLPVEMRRLFKIVLKKIDYMVVWCRNDENIYLCENGLLKMKQMVSVELVRLEDNLKGRKRLDESETLTSKLTIKKEQEDNGSRILIEEL